jgi:DNA phosphorothioation-associated putative methyltransferase
MSEVVLRHRTALTRADLSRPVKCLLADQLTTAGRVLDYGCGRGGDVRRLGELGVSAIGWDPVHFPASERQPTEVVMLNYVVNVIEDRVERAETLRAAWQLTIGVLMVAARLNWEDKSASGRPFGDGVMTGVRTFQKFFGHSELGDWIESVLGERPIAAAPGIYYVFRDTTLAQQFLAHRAATGRRRPSVDVKEAFELHRHQLGPLIEFLLDHARLPAEEEIGADDHDRILRDLGSWTYARRVAREIINESDWVEVLGARRAELLVYLGLSRFHGRPSFHELPLTLARDIRAQWSNYKTACADADQVLFATGNSQMRQLAARGAIVGKRTPSALYVHVEALGRLSPLLRLYEGCARLLAGAVDGANVIKLNTSENQVSYLAYPEFDRNPHPELTSAVTVNLTRLRVDRRSYERSNPPILHRKEEMVGDDHPRRESWQRLTASEERAGLYEHPERIGTLDGWRAALDERGVRLRGHRLVRVHPAAQMLGGS